MSEASDNDWIACHSGLPPDGKLVQTKIDDQWGVRNEQVMERRGRLWFLPNNGMYVYYEPTHWRPIK